MQPLVFSRPPLEMRDRLRAVRAAALQLTPSGVTAPASMLPTAVALTFNAALRLPVQTSMENRFH